MSIHFILVTLRLHLDGKIDRLQWIIVNRLVLNLKQTARNGEHDTEFQQRTGLPEPVFASNGTLGNIGAPLRVDYLDINEEASIDDEGYSTTYNSVLELPLPQASVHVE